MPSAPLRRPVLLYDDECRLCRFIARCVVRLDRRHELAFLPLRDEAAELLLAGLAPGERYDTWLIVQRDASVVGYGAGVPALLENVRLTRASGRLLRRVPRGAVEAVYRAVARRRRELGRLVRDGPAPRRFP